MTRYEHGFMNKCAEYGVDGKAFLNKTAFKVTPINRVDFLRKMLDVVAKGGEQRLPLSQTKAGSRVLAALAKLDNTPGIMQRAAFNKAWDAAQKSGKIKNPAIAKALDNSFRQLNNPGSYWRTTDFREILEHNADTFARVRRALQDLG